VGITAGGWMSARMALAAHARRQGGETAPFLDAKIATARFFARQILPRAGGLLAIVEDGAEAVTAPAALGL
jgi:hypothetical protein